MNEKVSQEEIDEVFLELKKNPYNNKCMDCQSRNPKWASVSLGLFLCMDCAGQHRNLGVQYTFARSLNLDTWTRKQLTYMIKGGNDKALSYFKKNGLQIKNISDYTSAVSLKYKEELNKIVEKEFIKEIKQNQQETIPQQQTQKQQQDQQIQQKQKEPAPEFKNNLKSNQKQMQPQIPLNQINQKGKLSSQVQPKGKVAGKKLGDFDFNALSIADKEKSVTPSELQPTEKKIIRKTSSSLELNQDSSEKRFNNYQSTNQPAHQPIYHSEETKEQYSKFNGQTSLSSAQLFGEQLESTNNNNNQDGYSLGQYIQLDSIMDYAAINLQKLKQSAGCAVDRIKQWKNQS